MSDKLHIDRDHLMRQLREMMRIRRFEERCEELYGQEKIRGFLHLCIGEEAIAVGVMATLQQGDTVVSTYREHGHALARGVPMGSVLAEMYGHSNGCCRGRGGSMHLFHRQHNFCGGNAIVGGGLPLAAGLAMAAKRQGRNDIAVCFFGEGAVAEGEFHEALNLAALWQLPVLFVCENNQYAMGTALSLSESETDIARKATGYGIVSARVDGMNVVDVETAARTAVEAIRSQGQPRFLECLTYRFRGHSSFDGQLYRDKAEVEQWKEKGPVRRLVSWLRENNHLQSEELRQMEQEVDREIEDAVRFAESGELEAVNDLYLDLYSPSQQGERQ